MQHGGDGGRGLGASSAARRLSWAFHLALLGLAAALFPANAVAQTFRVVVVPGLEIEDLERLSSRGAIGLLVPAAGPKTSERAARAALDRGEVRNSLRDGLPSGPRLITHETAAEPPAGGSVIVLSLPRGGEQANDRRYPIAVLGAGYRGLLTSDSTRIPGLVSIADVAPTALGRDDALGSKPEAEPVAELERLDEQIDANNGSRKTATRLAAILLVLLALLAPRAAVLGVAVLLVTNLVLGIAGATSEPVLLVSVVLAVALGGPAASLAVRSARGVGLVLAAVLGAYLVAFLVDDRWVALSPLGPTQNARFYGISNLLETLLLVPALGGAALLARRHVAPAVVVAAASFLVIAAGRFGADGGGAVVLAVGFAVLAGALAGAGRRRLALLIVAALALVVGAIALEAATGTTSHVTRALESGPGGLASDLRDRIELSYARATEHWQNVVIVVGGIAVLGALAVRLLRSSRPLPERALPLAFLAALGTSLVVNDSPVDVVIAGLACYLAVEAYALRPSKRVLRAP